MKIRAQCPNGHEFQCDAAHQGRKVRCPRPECDAKFRIEAVVDAANGIVGAKRDAAAHDEPTCPSCHEPVLPGALLCVSCGTILRTGARVETNTNAQVERPAPADFSNDPWSEQGFVERAMQFLGGVLLVATLAGLAGLSFYLATQVHYDLADIHWRLRRFFILGWEPTWWIVFILMAFAAIASLRQLVLRGRIDKDLGEV